MKALLLLALLAGEESVCNIPVFRYALERWPAAPYPAVVFHRGDSPRVTLEDGALNVAVEIVDLARPLSDAHRALWESLKAPSLPWLALRFPGADGALAWSGPYGGTATLEDSPARREIVTRLLKGDSAVWLLLESGKADLDAKAAALLAAELPRLEKSLPIPAPAPGDPPLRLDLPLAVKFSSLRLTASDPAEAAFVETLARVGTSLSLPAVFPVFGRGRTLGALHGAELTADGLEKLAKYVTAPCTCEVKEFNPGVDLLIRANWEQLLDLGPAPEPEPLPPVAIPPGQPASPAPVPAPPARPAFLGGVAAAAFGTIAVLAMLLLRAKR